jgi:hypothetical protein
MCSPTLVGPGKPFLINEDNFAQYLVNVAQLVSIIRGENKARLA